MGREDEEVCVIPLQVMARMSFQGNESRCKLEVKRKGHEWGAGFTTIEVTGESVRAIEATEDEARKAPVESRREQEEDLPVLTPGEEQRK